MDKTATITARLLISIYEDQMGLGEYKVAKKIIETARSLINFYQLDEQIYNELKRIKQKHNNSK